MSSRTFFVVCCCCYFLLMFLYVWAYMPVCAYDHTRCVALFTFKQCKLSHVVDVRIGLLIVSSHVSWLCFAQLFSLPFVSFYLCLTQYIYMLHRLLILFSAFALLLPICVFPLFYFELQSDTATPTKKMKIHRIVFFLLVR